MEAVTHCVSVKDNIYPANILLRANFLYQTLDSIDDAKSQAQRVHSTGAAKRSYPTSKERRLRGHRRAERSYSTFKVRRGNSSKEAMITILFKTLRYSLHVT